MKNYLIILFLALATSVQAQFVGLRASIANQSTVGYDITLSDLYVSQVSPNFAGSGSWFAGGVDISPDGTDWVNTSRNVDGIMYGTMTTAHDFATTDGYDGIYTIVDYTTPSPNSIRFEDAGTQVWVSDDGINGIGVWDLSTAYDFTSRTYNTWINLGSSSNEYSIESFDGGLGIIVTEPNTNIATEYSLSTAYDLESTVTYIRDITFADTGGSSADNHINLIMPDGKIWITADVATLSDNHIVKGTNSTANDFSTFTKSVENVNLTISTTDRIWALGYDEGEDYFFEASYSDDRLVKYRDESKETYVADKIIGIPSDDFWRIAPTNFPLASLGDEFTVVMDVFIETGTATTNYELVCGNQSNNFITRYDDTNERLFMQVYDGTNVSSIYTASSSFPADNEWHTLAFSYDPTVGCEIYIDGALSADNTDTDVPTYGATVDGSVPLYFGGRYGGSQYSGGYFRNVQVYDNQLSLAQNEDLHTDMTDTQTGLLANWADQKGEYFWKSELGGYYAGIELLTNVELPNVFLKENAASIWTEAEATTGWSTNSATVSVDTGDKTHGTASVKTVGTSNQTYSRSFFQWDGVVGEIYDIYWDGKWNGVGTFGRVRNSSGFTPGIGEIDMTTSWVSYESFGHRAISTACILQIYVPSDATNTLWMDNIKIESRSGEKYPHGNAASFYHEANTTTDWTDERLATVSVESTDVHHGDYAIKVTSGAQTYSNAYIEVDNLENGATYELKVWAKSGTYNASSPQQIYLDDASGWATGDVEVSVTTSTWTEYTIVKATSATTARIYLRANRNVGDSGQTLFGDRISLKKLN